MVEKIRTYTPLKLKEVSKMDKSCRFVRRTIARTSALAIRWDFLINSLLLQNLHKASQTGSGFSMPVPIVSACLDKHLHLSCRLADIGHVMIDWISDRGRKLHVSDYFLSAGEWEGILVRAGTSSVDIEAEELHNHNWNYRSTQTYKKYMKAVEHGNPLRRQQVLLDNRELVEDYFKRFVFLYHSIKKHGLLSHDKLSISQYFRDCSIGVAIGNSGQLCRLSGGQHRTAIARVLGLTKIPAEVRHVHINWLIDMMNKTKMSPISAIKEGIISLANGQR